MQWLQKALARIRGQKVTRIEDLFGGIPLHRFTNYESYLMAGTRKVWASWKACDLVAQVVQDTPYKVVRGKSADPITVQGLDKLLTAPNPHLTFPELLYLSTFHVKLTGNAFWYKSEGRAADASQPKELWPLNPKKVSVVADKAGLGEITGYLYDRDGAALPLELEEVIHFRRPHPNNQWYGLGDVEASEELFNEHINRDTWRRKFWTNGAAPSGVLICEDIVTDQEEWDKAKKKWQKEYGGSENAGKTAWLTGKWRYEQLGLTAQEMEDLERTKLTVEQIFQVHGVPLSVAGVREAANYATAEIDDQRFRQYTVKPIVKRVFEDTVNTDLVADYGDNLRIVFDVTGLVNFTQVAQSIAPAFDRGWLSINEARQMLGLEPDEENPNWEQHYITGGLTPLELAGAANLAHAGQEAQAVAERFVREVLTKEKGANGHGNRLLGSR